MIIQHVIKGIGGIERSEAVRILKTGIICNWWRNVDPLPDPEIPQRLTDRNLFWHQNRYSDPDPLKGGRPFHEHTPFISTTAGTVERAPGLNRNIVHPAWLIAPEFATDDWLRDGYLFHCYVFVLGKPTVHHRQFSEELRELNVYSGYSPYQPEGEITAKIIIPPTQIEKVSFYDINSVRSELSADRIPRPDDEIMNDNMYRPPEELSNIRDILS
jgi:hypothetical protein